MEGTVKSLKDSGQLQTAPSFTDTSSTCPSQEGGQPARFREELPLLTLARVRLEGIGLPTLAGAGGGVGGAGRGIGVGGPSCERGFGVAAGSISAANLGTEPPAGITARLRGPSAGGSTNSSAWNGLMAGGWT